MKYIELTKSLSKLDNIYLISGEDHYLCYDALEKIKNAINLSMPDMNSVYLETNDFEEVANACNIFPFIDAKRLVVVTNFCPNASSKTQKEMFEKYLSSPMQTTILVFFNTEDDSFFKNYKTKLTYVDCSKLDSNSICNYILKYFEKNNVVCTQKLAAMIDLYCLSDMQRIHGEIEKIVSYFGESGELTEEIVDNLVTKDKEYQIYSLTEYISRGDALRAIDLVDVLGRKGSMNILASLYSSFRRLFYVAVTPKSEMELAKELGVKEFAVKMMKMQIKNFTPKKLKQIVDYLMDIDSNIKKGKIKEEITAKLAVTELLEIRNA